MEERNVTSLEHFNFLNVFDECRHLFFQSVLWKCTLNLCQCLTVSFISDINFLDCVIYNPSVCSYRLAVDYATLAK